VKALQDSIAHGNPARINTVIHGQALISAFNNPATDSHTPALIIEPIPGTIYSTNPAKVAEHGGSATTDRHVALLVVNGPSGDNKSSDEGPGGTVVDAAVSTTQIAPSILTTLGLDPAALDAVRAEGTQVLPGFGGE
jgi:hypothetical protein